MANNFRNVHPKRTFTKSYSKYSSYKSYLSNDFNKRCGYTDCSDFWFGGSKTFHIDHFKPWKKNPHLKTQYSNLVYCCSYVNILKSDDEGSYLDPCDIDYNDHFERDTLGKIIPKSTSKEANYMYKKLKLYLQRYQIIWLLEKIFVKMEKLQEIIDKTPNGDFKNGLLITQGELAGYAITYRKNLSCNQ